MHSKVGIESYTGNDDISFPAGTINQSMIEALYGRYRSLDGMSKTEWIVSVRNKTFDPTPRSKFWKIINKLDLSKLIYDTKPKYYVLGNSKPRVVSSW